MDSRTKFQKTINFEPGARPPLWEFAYWADTLERWYAEGLPRRHGYARTPYSQWVAAEACCHETAPGFPRDAHDYFGFDEGIRSVPADMGPRPGFPEEEIGGDGENVILRRSDGKTVKTRKDGGSMPEFLDYPVKNMEDFKRFREHFDAEEEGRLPSASAGSAQVLRNRTAPLQIWGGVFTGFYSVIRELMGFENSLYAFYDDPDLIIAIQEFYQAFRMRMFERALSIADVDYILIWEDMAFRNGPMVSPAMFRDVLMPYYRRFTGEMRRRFGVKHFFVDCDGDFTSLIPSFLEGGVTGFYPFEVQAGMDIEAIRAQYPGLVIMGGVDKLALAQGRAAIARELKKVERMLPLGGYIPYTDHMVPPDVSLADYRYYREGLKSLIG